MMMAMVKTSPTKWKVIKNAFLDASTKVSDNARTFALSGIATIWIFKKEVKTSSGLTYEIDNTLAISAGLIFLFLAIDLLQYLYKTIMWQIYRNRVYKETDDPDEETTKIEVWVNINLPVACMFYLKCIVLVGAYGALMFYLASIIKFV
jgi:hypothetical protein